MTPRNPYLKTYIMVTLCLVIIGLLAYFGVQYGRNYVNSNGRLPFITH